MIASICLELKCCAFHVLRVALNEGMVWNSEERVSWHKDARWAEEDLLSRACVCVRTLISANIVLISAKKGSVNIMMLVSATATLKNGTQCTGV